MGLFDKIKAPIFLKEGSIAEQQLQNLKIKLNETDSDSTTEIKHTIKLIEAGIYGENNIAFELKNSYMPMVVLHDIYLEHDDLSAQIDYIVITRNKYFIIECKNLYGNIEINHNGDFIRTISYGKTTKKEAIYSPITQLKRHTELIKAIGTSSRNNILAKTLFEKGFYDTYVPIVVLANPKTILNDRFAPKEIKNQVIRADQLAEYIRKVNNTDSFTVSEKRMMDVAQNFLEMHFENEEKYLQRYGIDGIEEKANENIDMSSSSEEALKCPRCGSAMVLRKAVKGKNIGNEFYGCSSFPKCRAIITP